MATQNYRFNEGLALDGTEQQVYQVPQGKVATITFAKANNFDGNDVEDITTWRVPDGSGTANQYEAITDQRIANKENEDLFGIKGAVMLGGDKVMVQAANGGRANVRLAGILEVDVTS